MEPPCSEAVYLNARSLGGGTEGGSSFQGPPGVYGWLLWGTWKLLGRYHGLIWQAFSNLPVFSSSLNWAVSFALPKHHLRIYPQSQNLL